MCDFFSFVWDGGARFLYTTRAERAAWGYRSEDDLDSHTGILTRAGIPPRDQDKWSKYEAVYDERTGRFTFHVDNNAPGHDVKVAHAWWESWTRDEFLRCVGMSGYCTQRAQEYTQWAQACTQSAQEYTQRAQEYTQWAQACTQLAQAHTQLAQKYTTYAAEWRKIEEAL